MPSSTCSLNTRTLAILTTASTGTLGGMAAANARPVGCERTASRSGLARGDKLTWRTRWAPDECKQLLLLPRRCARRRIEAQFVRLLPGGDDHCVIAHALEQPALDAVPLLYP